MDFKDACDFIELLTGDRNTVLSFQTFDDKEINGKKRKKKSLIRSLDGSLKEVQKELTQLNRNDAGVFVVVNEKPSDLANKDEYVTRIRALFIDQDGKVEYPPNWHVEPSIIVKRDLTHWHAYWLLNDNLPVDKFKAAQIGLSKDYDTDPSICNPARIMRVPGFFHNKGKPVPVKLVRP